MNFSFFFVILFFNEFSLAQNSSGVSIGVVQDFESDYGKGIWASLSLALDDFYAKHVKFSSRVALYRKDSEDDILGAASAAIELIKNNKVQAILGPITSSETKFVAELCSKTQIPIVSFTASSPSLSSFATPYFVRATLNDTSQVGAIAAVVNYYGWREVVPVYEDTDFGSGTVPFLIEAFDTINTRVPYRCVVPSKASDEWFEAELYKLMSMQTRVFVVHMMPELGKRFFLKAKELSLMTSGYVWITTDSLINNLHTPDPTTLDSMEGIIGVRSYIPRSNAIRNFIPRWHKRYARDYPTDPRPADPTVYQYQAYDALWALALAVEKAGKLNQTFDPPAGMDNPTDLTRLGISRSGPKLLNAISSIEFSGLAGEFKLVNGQMLSSNFKIVNVLGKDGTRVVGFWSPEVNLVKDLQSVSAVGLKPVIWPGDDKHELPRGWEVPMLGKKLKIGVPIKKGFKEFVNVEIDEITNRVSVTGYSIDIFEAAMNTLPYYTPYYYIPYDVGWYDDFLMKVYEQKFDAIVGDITILANRSNYVDFTLPYMQSGVSMAVRVKEDNNNMWVFLRPLTTDLWLWSLAFFFFTGFVVWVIEHRTNEEFRGPPSQQMGTIFYFAFSTLVYAHKERLQRNLSRCTVTIWVFVVLILTSSYTASLSSMLTVQKLQPTFTDLSEIVESGGYIGIHKGSDVACGILKQQPNYNSMLIRRYNSSKAFAQALKLGSANGGVDAIFDEIPYLKIFLADNCDDYMIVGRIFRTDGFGFVFPRGSPLVSDISRGVLNVTQGCTMSSIERKWFGDQTACPTDTPSFTKKSLQFQSFGGLFLITGCVSLLALVAFLVTFLYKERGVLNAAPQSTFWRRVLLWVKHFDTKVVDVRPSSAGEGMQSPDSVVSVFTNFNHDSPVEEYGSFREEHEIRVDEVCSNGR